jgi:biopolymer transport protein ExbB
MHSRKPWCVAGAAAWLLVGVSTAWAQSAATERQSLLKIIRDGIEIPTYFILIGSVVTIALIVEHFLSVRAATISPTPQVKQVRSEIELRRFRECFDKLRQSRTFFARVMTAALQHHRHGFEAMHEAALEKSGELSGRMFRKAEYLNIIGNLGPLLGLLGTVWGMIEAFGSLGLGGGQAGAGDLAGGISKALVNTLLGLALAIVAIAFFGVCRNRIESLTVAGTVDALDLLEYFRPVSTTLTAPRPAGGVASAATPVRLPAAPVRPASAAPPTRASGFPAES